KSTSDAMFSSAIRDYEHEQRELFKPKLSQYEAERKAWEAQCLGIEAAIKSESRKGKDVFDLTLRLETLTANKPEAPRVPRIIRQDETPESLAYKLSSEWPSCALLSAEAGLILGAQANSSDSIMRNLAMQNALWSGEEINIGRKTTKSFDVRGARLS